MSYNTQHSVGEKIEVLARCEKEGWSATEASIELKIPRTTLLGWIASKDELFSSQLDPLSKRVAQPGKAAPTQEFEPGIVELITQRAAADKKMSRGDITAECVKSIPGFGERLPAAQKSWVTRFIKRHDLSTFISRFSLKAKAAGSSEYKPPLKRAKLKVSSLPETSKRVVSSLPEKPKSLKVPVMSYHPRAVPREIISLVSDTSEVTTYGPGDAFVDPSTIVCETQTPCFTPGKTPFRVAVQDKDLATLERDEWLNDNVITYYSREHIPAYGRTFIMDANVFGFIFAAYKTVKRRMKAAYNDCCGVTATFPYADYDHVIVPVCMGFHWTFAIVQNPVLATTNLRRCIVLVESLGITSLETVTKVLGVYFDSELKAKFGDRRATPFVAKGVRTSPKQTNAVDCGVFVLYFMKRVAEALLRGNVLSLSDTEKICTASRSARFSPNMFRKEVMNMLSTQNE